MARKQMKLTPEEVELVKTYRLGKKLKARNPAPAAEPQEPEGEYVTRPRYEFQHFSEEYQIALHIMSSLAYGSLLPSDLAECDEEGGGKLFYFFFENIAQAVSEALNKVDTIALLRNHK